MDSLYDNYDGEPGGPAGAQELGNQLAAVEEDIGWMIQERLLASARLWRVHVSRQKGLWIRTHYRNMSMLTPEAQHDVRERIWQHQLAVFGFVFGLSSIIQAVYAVLSYYKW